MLIPQYPALILKLSPITRFHLTRYFQFPKISVIRGPPVIRKSVKLSYAFLFSIENLRSEVCISDALSDSKFLIQNQDIESPLLSHIS